MARKYLSLNDWILCDSERISREPDSEIPLFIGSNRETCAELPSQLVAKQWDDQDHTYLDNDGDGIPCESLPL